MQYCNHFQTYEQKNRLLTFILEEIKFILVSFPKTVFNKLQNNVLSNIITPIKKGNHSNKRTYFFHRPQPLHSFKNKVANHKTVHIFQVRKRK